MRSLWKLRCPEGHSSIECYGSSYRCKSCERVYDDGPFDVTETEFPVDGVEPREKASRQEVLRAVVSLCNKPMRSCARASELDIPGSNRQIGRTLSALCADGLVRKMSNESRGHHWRPTDAGRQRVVELERERVFENGPDRGRAQVSTPSLIGLATVFVGLVLIAGFAIGTCGVGL